MRNEIDNKTVFNNEVNIGDKFNYSYKLNRPAIIIDILRLYSLAENKYLDNVIYVAKLIDGLSTNSFEVSKATVVRNRIIN